MKNIKYLFLFVASVFLLNSCEIDAPETSDLNYVTFEATDMDLGVKIDGSNQYEITIYSTQIVGTDRTFSLSIDNDATTADPQAYEVPASVTIPANQNSGTFVLGLNDVNIGGDGVNLALVLNVEDDVFKGGDMNILITQICDKNEVVVNLQFDDWGSECAWELLDGSGNAVGSGSGYSDGDAGASAKYCLDAGEYTFNIIDAYGDGGSTVSIIVNGSEVVSIAPDYGAGTSASFTIN